MKKAILFLLVIFSVAPALGTVQPDIAVENISSQPATPGETVKMFVVASNQGSTDATFEPLDVETVEGIEFSGTTSDFSDSFQLCGGCQRVGTLYFHVGSDLNSGTYPVDIGLSNGDSGVVGKFELEVDGNPKLIVENDQINVSPGEKVETELRLSNIGTDKASQTTVKPSAELLETQPGEPTFGEIAPGETKTRQLTVSADEEIGSGLKSLDLKLSYMDENAEIEKDSGIKLNVKKKAELALSNFELDQEVIGESSSLTVQIENLGPGEAERIVSELSCENAEVTSARSFIGQLDDEESVPAVFEIVPQAGNVECSTDISYSDSKQRQISENFNFSAERKNSLLLPVAIAIVVLLAGIYYWRKRREDELEEI